jgi:hypothetical protein
MRLLVSTDKKTLDLDSGQSHTKRFSGPNTGQIAVAPTATVPSADFGLTTYSYDNPGRIEQQKGDRDGFSAVETRTYELDLPLIKDITKLPLTGTGGPYVPNPDNSSVVAGKTYTWNDKHVQGGPSTVVDKIDLPTMPS